MGGRLRAGRQRGYSAGHEPGVRVLRPLNFDLLGPADVRAEEEAVREGAAGRGLLSSSLLEGTPCLTRASFLPLGPSLRPPSGDEFFCCISPEFSARPRGIGTSPREPSLALFAGV